MAIANNVSDTTVARARASIAAAWLRSAMELLEELLDQCKGTQPIMACELMKWDEAQCALSCSIFSQMQARIGTQRLSWAILLSRRWVAVGFSDGTFIACPSVVPPQPMLANNAGSLDGAVFLAPRAGQDKLVSG